MKTQSIVALFVVSLAGTGVFSACQTSFTCNDLEKCNVTAGAGNGGNGGTAGDATGGSSKGGSGANSGGNGSTTTDTTATCDTSKSPNAEACLVANKYAVFVSPDGNDTDAGTQTAPVKTVAKALSLATTKKSVIACSGTYTESLSITGRAKIYGSFDCSNDWKYDKTKPTVVTPTSVVPALNITAVSALVVIEDVQFKALDATTPSGSSVAALVKDSTNVSLRRVSLTAGNGAAAITPAISPYTFADVSTLAGNAGQQFSGGAAVPCTCPNGSTTTRGGGGPPSANGGPGTPTYDTTSGIGGDTKIDCSVTGGSGGKGSDAPLQSTSVGAATFGTFANDNWTPASGTAGLDGQPGQGGGGGAGKSDGGGGSGACGGCGGKGGSAGNGGGASIALLSVNSTINLEASTLATGNGGSGSDGTAGQDGQVGGFKGRGFGTTVASGCDGGNGGNGAAGAPGGGGAGGISVGILYSGTVPSTDASTKTTLGQPGIGGKGGNNTLNTDDGIDGTAAKTLAIP